ncbi:MAG: glycosyltransferase family 87 protein [Ktedonobacterales bacterium]
MVMYAPGHPSDFAMYYAAAWTLRIPGMPSTAIYSLAQLATVQAHACPMLALSTYIYPPFLAIVMEPLTRLPCDTAQRIWMVLNAALWLTSALLMAREVRRLFRSEIAHAIALLLSLLCFPAWWGFSLGQITFVMLLGFVVLPWLVREHPRWAGGVLALLIWIKVYPALLLIWCIANRRWAVVRATAIVFALLTVMVIVAVGLSGLIGYQTGMAAGFGYSSVAHNEAPSRAVVWIMRLIAAPLSSDVASTSALLLLIIVAAAFVALAHRVWTNPANEQIEAASYAATLSALLLLSPLVWAHYWVWLLPAIVAYLRSLPQRTDWRGKLALGCALLTCLPLPFNTDTVGLLIPADAHSLAAVASLRASLLLVRIIPVCLLFALAIITINKTTHSRFLPMTPRLTTPASVTTDAASVWRRLRKH